MRAALLTQNSPVPFGGMGQGDPLPNPVAETGAPPPRASRRNLRLANVPPFDGMGQGEPLEDPVATPATGVQSIPAMTRAQDRHQLRDPDAEQRAVYQDARPRPESFDLEAPLHLRPPGVPDRAQRHPITTTNDRTWTRFNDNWGAHGELVAGVQTNPGTMNPGTSSHRNTHRLPPEQWDTAVFIPAGA